MLAASKRATAATVTLSNAGLDSGANINPIPMRSMMERNITRAPEGATHTILIAEDHSRLLNPGEPIKFTATLDVIPVVTRSAVPMYDSCRVLAARGLRGQVAYVRADGVVGMTMDIEAGAKLTVVEGPNGPRVRKFDDERLAEAMTSGRKAAAPAQVLEEAF